VCVTHTSSGGEGEGGRERGREREREGREKRGGEGRGGKKEIERKEIEGRFIILIVVRSINKQSRSNEQRVVVSSEQTEGQVNCSLLSIR
jgi:hypothetical protein